MSAQRFLSGPFMVSALALALAAVFALSSCGGSSNMATPGSGRVTLAGALSGTPAALTFNQQPVNTSGATVTMNGEPAEPGDLQPGMVVRGHGRHGDGGLDLEDADVVKEAQGPISAIDPTASTLTVLGIIVTTDPQTRFKDHGPTPLATLTLAGLAVGDNVEVFGLRQPAGPFLATRIDREPANPAGAVELRGVLTGLDTTAKTFSLGPILVDYSTAQVHGNLVEGAHVEVKGALTNPTSISAAKVRVEQPLEAEDEGETELSGPLSALDTTAKTFTLQAFKVDYSTAMVTGTLAAGANVEVHGSVSTTDSTVLMADRVEVEDHAGSVAP